MSKRARDPASGPGGREAPPPPPAHPSSSSSAAAAAAEEEEEEPEDPLIALRRRALRQYAAYTAPARAAVTVRVGAGGAAWHPLFAHQAFPLGRIFGYRAPRVAVTYTDPELRVAAAGAAEAVKLDAVVPRPDMSGKLVSAPRDGRAWPHPPARPPARPRARPLAPH